MVRVGAPPDASRAEGSGPGSSSPADSSARPASPSCEARPNRWWCHSTHPARIEASAVRARLGHLTIGPETAATSLVETIMRSPGELSLVCIGPLTNLALALSLEPAIAGAVTEVVIMGGAFFRQTNSVELPGEFNIWIDPDAAAIVFNSGMPLRLVGLDRRRSCPSRSAPPAPRRAHRPPLCLITALVRR